MDVVSELIQLRDIPPWALVAGAVWSIYRGRWVAWPIFEEMKNDRDRWRESSEHKDETIRILASSSTTAATALQSLERVANTKTGEVT